MPLPQRKTPRLKGYDSILTNPARWAMDKFYTEGENHNMIAIVDYGVGNLFSLSSSVKSLGAEVRVTRDAADLRAADHILLPGVGAFADAMAKLEATGLVPVLREETQKKPLLGICLGMQLLFEKSCEYGEHRGLGLIPGEVCPLADDLTDPALKVPHIGWNAMDIVPGREDDPLFKYVRDGENC